jgi:hypothetical protein
MADITLADYTGYIFLEIIKARQMADLHSAELAKVYAQDPVLKHFSVPRFKVPRMELTIPVLISGARFSQVVRFAMPRDKFLGYVFGRLDEVARALSTASDDPFGNKVPKGVVARDGPAARGKEDSTEGQARAFWQSLSDSPELALSIVAVRNFWSHIFETMLVERKLMEQFKSRGEPAMKLLADGLDDLARTLNASVVVDKTTVESLLINPETNVVKNGSSDTSVFTIKAEMLEEGFFVRTLKDEATGQETSVVEFE